MEGFLFILPSHESITQWLLVEPQSNVAIIPPSRNVHIIPKRNLIPIYSLAHLLPSSFPFLGVTTGQLSASLVRDKNRPSSSRQFI